MEPELFSVKQCQHGYTEINECPHCLTVRDDVALRLLGIIEMDKARASGGRYSKFTTMAMVTEYCFKYADAFMKSRKS